MAREPAADRAARAALGVGPEAGLPAVEAAFRQQVMPLSQAAAADAEASARLRLLIEARAHLRASLAARRGPADRPAANAAARAAHKVRPLGFRLAADGRDVEVLLSLDMLVAEARRGETRVTITAPVLRRCASCASAGRFTCGTCAGAGVVATVRSRAVPLDLERIAADDFAIEASPWADAHGRGARGGPLFRARLV
ncbi:MAG: hypothetical protein EA355_09525 [Rhodobacteraceae bacterium]|nr:MAG: hypothetical protein EA355_09525 [Paracoccaceae bacterium]